MSAVYRYRALGSLHTYRWHLVTTPPATVHGIAHFLQDREGGRVGDPRVGGRVQSMMVWRAHRSILDLSIGAAVWVVCVVCVVLCFVYTVCLYLVPGT
jgi:hypothetical protein